MYFLALQRTNVTRIIIQFVLALKIKLLDTNNFMYNKKYTLYRLKKNM